MMALPLALVMGVSGVQAQEAKALEDVARNMFGVACIDSQSDFAAMRAAALRYDMTPMEADKLAALDGYMPPAVGAREGWRMRRDGVEFRLIFSRTGPNTALVQYDDVAEGEVRMCTVNFAPRADGTTLDPEKLKAALAEYLGAPPVESVDIGHGILNNWFYRFEKRMTEVVQMPPFDAIYGGAIIDMSMLRNDSAFPPLPPAFVAAAEPEPAADEMESAQGLVDFWKVYCVDLFPDFDAVRAGAKPGGLTVLETEPAGEGSTLDIFELPTDAGAIRLEITKGPVAAEVAARRPAFAGGELVQCSVHLPEPFMVFAPALRRAMTAFNNRVLDRMVRNGDSDTAIWDNGEGNTMTTNMHMKASPEAKGGTLVRSILRK